MRRTISGGSGRARASSRRWLERQLGLLARQELAEQQGAVGQRVGRGARQQRPELVAQREQAGRLQPDHRHRRRPELSSVRRASSRALSTMPAARKRAAAAEWTAALIGQPHAIAGGSQHAQRGAQVLRFEPAIERVGKQQHLAALLRRGERGGLAVAEGVAPPDGQGTRRGKAKQAFAQPAQRGDSRLRRLASGAIARNPTAHNAAVRRSANRAASDRCGRAVPPAPRSSSSPCRRRSGIRACTPCRTRTAPSHRPPHRTPSHRRRAGRSAPGAACWRARASGASRRA